MKILQYRFIAVLSVILFFQTINAQVILTHIGRHPFYPASLTSSIELITMVNDNKNDVREGFEMVGLSELFDVFALQLPKADIKIVKIHDGSHLNGCLPEKMGKDQFALQKM